MERENGPRPRALVTGASAGIGATFAERLARDNYDLVVVARRRELLDALARQLEQAHGVSVQVLAADLTQPDDLRRVERQIADDQALDLLINNAGFPGYMPFVELDPDRAEELIRLHVVTTTRLARAALPGMVARGRGAIVNVASMLAFSAPIPASAPMPKRVVYAACKAYIVAFSELLHRELEGSGVQVQALCPGLVGGTEFHASVPGFDRSRLAQAGVMPEDVVTASLAGLRLGEVICAPGLDDAALIEQFRDSEQQLVARGARGGLAPRYTAT
jgi:short-subunit dehydrogenase